jgi:hypothetical protein
VMVSAFGRVCWSEFAGKSQRRKSGIYRGSAETVGREALVSCSK